MFSTENGYVKVYLAYFGGFQYSAGSNISIPKYGRLIGRDGKILADHGS